MRGIYKITNTNNNKCYIGKSENLAKRLKYHMTTLKGGYNKNKHMQNAYNKSPEKTFTIEILEELTEDMDINEREKYWINFYNSYDREYGYNRTAGGDGGDFLPYLTPEEREVYLEKSSKSMTGSNNPLFEKHCYTDGIIIKYISDSEIEEYEQHGWWNGVPDRVKEKERLANLGDKNGFFGKNHSEETKKKLSELRKGDKNWNYGKIMYHKGDLQTYISPNEVKQYEEDGWIKGMAPYIKNKISKNKQGVKRNTINEKAIKYLYNGNIYHGWRKMKEFLKLNGYPKISESSIIKLANDKKVKGYDDLYGKISIIK